MMAAWLAHGKQCTMTHLCSALLLENDPQTVDEVPIVLRQLLQAGQHQWCPAPVVRMRRNMPQKLQYEVRQG